MKKTIALVPTLVVLIATTLAQEPETIISPDRALLRAAQRGDLAGIEYALANGANVNAKNLELGGITALHIAALMGDQRMAELLALQHKADTMVTTDVLWRGATPLHYALSAGNTRLVNSVFNEHFQLVLKDPAYPIKYFFHEVLQKGIIKSIKILIANGAEIHENIYPGCTAVEYILSYFPAEKIQLLLEDSEVKTVLRQKSTAEHQRNYFKILKDRAAYEPSIYSLIELLKIQYDFNESDPEYTPSRKNDPAECITTADDLEEMEGCRQDMLADNFKPEYVEQIIKHRLALRNQGLHRFFPTELSADNCGPKPTEVNRSLFYNLVQKQSRLCDPKGIPFGGLRANSRLFQELSDYMQLTGGDFKIIQEWLEDQGNSSQNPASLHVKQFFANQRTLDQNSYTLSFIDFDLLSSSNARPNLTSNSPCIDLATFEASLTVWHAFILEVLSHTDFMTNAQETHTVCLVRGISQRRISRNNMQQKTLQATMKREPYESSSIAFPWSNSLKQILTFQRMPHHRVIALYFLGPHHGESFFGDFDSESEAVMITDSDTPFDIISPKASFEKVFTAVMQDYVDGVSPCERTTAYLRMEEEGEQ